jgi:hypothetical protein
MILPGIGSAEDDEKKWWLAWRKVDFSWLSIGERDAKSGEAWQDYWRSDFKTGAIRSDAELLDSGELEKDSSGRLWHLAHVPLVWDDGSPTWKQDQRHAKWKLFWDVIRVRLDATSTGNAFFAGEEDDEDREPGSFAGVVFGATPEDWIWHNPGFQRLNAEFQTCAFLGNTSFFGVEPKANLDLRYCIFYGAADFNRLESPGDIQFGNSMFLSSMSMDDARINGKIEFADSRFHKESTFLRSRIGGDADFSRCVFYGPCGFERTKFAKEANFSWSRFLYVVSFFRAFFAGKTMFLENVFSDHVSFGGRCFDDFYFLNCTAERDADFAFMRFRKGAFFGGSRFLGLILFQTIYFYGRASFSDTAFESYVRFTEVHFRGRIEFDNAVFHEAADLSGCHFPPDARHYHAAFRGAEFRRVANFTIKSFFAWGAFSEALFQQKVLFTHDAIRNAASFDRAFEAARQAALADVQATNSLDARKNRLTLRFAELEAAFQALKQGMARQQSRFEEHRFYRFELLARRQQSGVSMFERGMTWLYDRSSRCGTSFILPLVWLGALILVSGAGYWTLTKSGCEIIAALNPYPVRHIDGGFIQAIRFSMENVVQPLSAWSFKVTDANEHSRWIESVLNSGGPMRLLLIRLVATLQSGLSVALLFFFALAVKRRFQMQA